MVTDAVDTFKCLATLLGGQPDLISAAFMSAQCIIVDSCISDSVKSLFFGLTALDI